MAKKPEREIERWVTWHGARIPIFKGESNDDVRERMRQRAQKGKENRPVTKEGQENLRRKAADAERKAMHAIEDEKANPTERRKRLADKANKEADNAWSKYNKVWNKKEDGKRINKVKFNKQTKADEKKEDFVVDYDLQKALDMKEAKRAKSHESYIKKQQANKEVARKALEAGENTPKTKEEAQALKEKYTPTHYTKSELEDAQFRKDALAEMRRYERNWSFYSAKEKRNISPEGIKGLRDRIKEIENYEKQNSKANVDKDKDKISIDPVSGLLKKPDIDIGGAKYDAAEQVDAINYMYGYDSLPKARKAILEGKHSEDDIKRAILYHELDGLPYKEKKKAYEQSLKTHGLEKKSEKSWQDKDEEVKAKQIANSEKQKAERNGKLTEEDIIRQKLKAREAAAFERDKASAKQNLDSLKAALKEHPDDIHTNYIKERIKAAEEHYAAFKKGKYPESPEFKTAKEWDAIDNKSPRQQANEMGEKELRQFVKLHGLTRQYNMMLNNRPSHSHSNAMSVLRDLVADYLAVEESKRKGNK